MATAPRHPGTQPQSMATAPNHQPQSTATTPNHQPQSMATAPSHRVRPLHPVTSHRVWPLHPVTQPQYGQSTATSVDLAHGTKAHEQTLFPDAIELYGVCLLKHLVSVSMTPLSDECQVLKYYFSVCLSVVFFFLDLKESQSQVL